jgi:hypothetical protein
VGNILDVVLRVRSDENLSLVGPPPLAHQNYFSDKLFGGGVSHTGYPVTQFGYPGQPGKADVMHESRIGVARAPLRGLWWM